MRLNSSETAAIRNAERVAVLYFPSYVEGHQYAIGVATFGKPAPTYPTRDAALKAIRRQRPDLKAADIPTLENEAPGFVERRRAFFERGVVVYADVSEPAPSNDPVDLLETDPLQKLELIMFLTDELISDTSSQSELFSSQSLLIRDQLKILYSLYELPF